MGNMRVVVEKHAPIINRINPAALISDSFYTLNNYDSMNPVSYTHLVEDNGTDIKVKEAQIAKAQVSGIGLSNMRERVEALGGTIAFLTDKGFEIRISVPKMSKTRGTR